jgi:hypothetical protein
MTAQRAGSLFIIWEDGLAVDDRWLVGYRSPAEGPVAAVCRSLVGQGLTSRVSLQEDSPLSEAFAVLSITVLRTH